MCQLELMPSLAPPPHLTLNGRVPLQDTPDVLAILGSAARKSTFEQRLPCSWLHRSAAFARSQLKIARHLSRTSTRLPSALDTSEIVTPHAARNTLQSWKRRRSCHRHNVQHSCNGARSDQLAQQRPGRAHPAHSPATCTRCKGSPARGPRHTFLQSLWHEAATFTLTVVTETNGQAETKSKRERDARTKTHRYAE